MSQTNPSIFQVPEINPDQFGQNNNGSVKQEVNLFRGDVNFNVPLIKSKGRNGLSLTIAAQYQSNIAQESSNSNLDAPTGSLGMGWQLTGSKIVASYGGSVDSTSYAFIYNGGSNAMYRSPGKWQRGTLPTSFTADLDEARFSGDLQKSFLEQSLRIDAQATISTVIKGSQWIISDAVNEVQFLVLAESNSLTIYNGGELYDLMSYNFSRIVYYKTFEKWVFIDKKGIVKTFGGGVTSSEDGIKSSVNNSIEWEVRWGSWQGPGMLTRNNNGQRIQTQHPRAWNHSTSETIWSDQILYEYEQVTQPVGTEGLPYTKECHLKKVTDIFGKTILLTYDNKEFVADIPEGPREFLDPHKPIPDNTPDAYQSRYETKYLRSIQLNATNGDLLYTINMDYELALFATLQDSSPDLYGDSIKRVLTKITKTMAGGRALPSEEYEYYSAGEENPGALKIHTNTDGATVAYSYQKQSLTQCSRSLTLNKPSGGGVPRVWFGPDYAVVLWCSNQGLLTINIYTWAGRWINYTPKNHELQTYVDLNTLQVITQSNYTVISFSDSNDSNSKVLTYYKDNRVFGNWIESSLNPITVKSSEIAVTGGESFFVVNNIHSNIIDRYTWSSQEALWVKDTPYDKSSEQPGMSRFFVTTSTNLMIVLDYDIQGAPGSKNNVLDLQYLDALANWNLGDSIKAQDISIAGPNISANFHWTPGSWLFVATAVISQDEASFKYNLSIYQWTTDYKFTPAVVNEYSLGQTSNESKVIPYIAQVSNTGMIISGPHLLRYNGEKWLKNENLKIQLPVNDQTLYWFANSGDIVLKTENSPDQIISLAQVFDPNSNIDDWQEGSITIFNNPPVDSRLDHYYPTAAQDYVTFNTSIYHRGASNDWQVPFKNPITGYIPSNANVTSLINEGLEFMAFLIEQGGIPQYTQVLQTRNGVVRDGGKIAGNFFKLIESDGRASGNSNGMIPAGPSSFMTYLPINQAFDDAQTLTLHRYLNDNLSQPVTTFSVFKVEINDGFAKSTTFYDFDPSNAAVDSLGTTSKYYSCKVYTESAETFGWSEHFFKNGIGLQPVVGNPGLSAAFDGLPEAVDIYDSSGKKIANKSYSWEAHTVINDFKGNSIPIKGIYVVPTEKSDMLDGVNTSTLLTYDLASGENTSKEISVFNGNGKQETQTQTITLGYQKYALLRYLNILASNVQTIETVEEEGSSYISSNKVITWKIFDSVTIDKDQIISAIAPFKSFDWIGGDSTFNFEEWSSDQDPPCDYAAFQGWLKKSEVRSRSSKGNATETLDVQERMHSVIYDQAHHLQVAAFVNASTNNQEASFCGFEDYEENKTWELNSAATIISNNARSGVRSLNLAQQGAINGRFQPQTKRTSVLAFWYKTPPGYQANTTSGWNIQLNGTEPGTLFKGFEATDGQWKFDSITIDPNPATDAPFDFSIQAMNTDSHPVIIDNIRLMPQLSQFTAKVYHPDSLVVMNKLGEGDDLETFIYDDFFRQIGTAGPYNDQVSSFSLTYLAKQNTKQISPITPNQTLSLKCLDGGHFETFRDGNGWMQRWNATNSESNWKQSDGMLTHLSDTVADSLSPETSELLAFAVYFEISNPNQYSPLTLSDSVGIQINADSHITWDALNSQWSIVMEGHEQPTPDTATLLPQQWLLLVNGNDLFFYANNQLICSYTDSNLSISLAIDTGKNILALKNLTLMQKPMTAVEFQDGAQKIHQKQVLTSGNTIVTQLIYDGRAKQIVITKDAPLRFASTGTGAPLLTYSQSFADVTDFLTNLDITGLMKGNVSSYYNGENNTSNDDGYPYSRDRLESSPLARVIEKGFPGKDNAIINPLHTSPADRHTLKYTYSANTLPDENLLTLPKAEYFMVSQTDQQGNTSSRILDKTRKLVSKQSDAIISQTATQYNASGKVVNHHFPNYFNKEIEGAEKFIQTDQYDLLGKLTQTQHPDSGVTSFIRNTAGYIRFAQDSEGRAQGYYQYKKYDQLNRLTETGICNGSWDEVTLRGHAEDINWPSDQHQMIQKKLTYILYDGSINGVGKLKTSNNTNTENQIAVKEEYAYDSYGNIAKKSIETLKGDTVIHSSEVSYENSFTGKPIRINYPESAPVTAVMYTYDELDRLIQVGDLSTAEKYASYGYSPEGEILSASGNSNHFSHSMSYYSRGSLKSIVDSSQGEGYTELINSRYDNDKVKMLTDSFDHNGKQNSLITHVAFNTLDQLLSVSYENETDWNLTVNSYDGNGNFLSVTQGSEQIDYHYKEGTDQVQQVNSDLELFYNANGGVSRTVSHQDNSELNFSYHKDGVLVDSIAVPSLNKTFNFGYNNHGQRVVKESVTPEGTTEKIYIHGKHALPLMEIEDGEPTAYIYGLHGLVSFVKSNTMYFVSSDHQGSIRQVRDEGGNMIAEYTYKSYGAPGRTGGSNPDIINYLYTGQEWDKELNLYNYRARFYNPGIGIFYSTDPKNQTASPYVYVNNDPFDFTDPTGESFMGDVFSWIAQTIISAAEIIAAVAIDVVTEGAGTAFTGALLGAGISGATEEISEAATHKGPDWGNFGEAQAIGAASGAVSAGIGSFAEGAETSAANFAENSLSFGAKASKAAGKGASILVGSVAQSSGAVTGKLVENIMSKQPLMHGMGQELLIGAISGGIGGSLSQSSKAILGPRPSAFKKIASAAVVGTLGGASGAGVVTLVEGKKMDPFDLGLAIAVGSVKGFLSIRPNAPEEPFAPTVNNPSINDTGEGNKYITNEQL